MDILQKKEGNNGSFFVQINNKTVAKMTYTLENPSIMIIDHTEVDLSLRGQNIAMELVNKAVSFAREHSLKIKPVCQYVHSVFMKHPEDYKNIIYT